jgi:hypothetical protein
MISNGINGLFQMPVDKVRSFLPKNIEPIETNHGVGLVGITMFHFSESPIGPYDELVISAYVVPRMGLTSRHQHAAVHPIVVASTYHEARQHAIDLWHLPHFMEDIYIRFEESDDRRVLKGTAFCYRDEPIVSLEISQSGTWRPVQQFYQSFQKDSSGSYVGVLDMTGELSEHEGGTGTLVLYPQHRLFEKIDLSELDPFPYREMWMKHGVENYHDLLSVDFY